MNESLKQKLAKLPVAPGVYFHKNQAGEIIYVGKAAVLKNRVRQYFQKSSKDAKTAALVREIYDTDWIVVDTEMDALFLESEMIKRYMPKWNILLRDDKTVSYVRISMNEEVPNVSFTRTPMDDKATYIGPFYGKLAVAKALRILRRVFPYYDKPYTGKKTLNTDLGLTPGIEIGKTTPKDYKRNLRKLIRYLEGGREKLLKELEKTMYDEAEKGNYELAAEARDQLFSLKGLKKKIVFSDKEFLDISSDRALKLLQELLDKQWITSEKVLNAMRQVDRKDFAPTNPYENNPQRIPCNVVISAPLLHAYCLELLKFHLTKGCSVLDVGSGSGYLTVALSKMMDDNGLVVGIEHMEDL